MPTTVTIQAHCSDDKEVVIAIHSIPRGQFYEKFVLNDGESTERYVYDDRTISVTEVLKQA